MLWNVLCVVITRLINTGKLARVVNAITVEFVGRLSQKPLILSITDRLVNPEQIRAVLQAIAARLQFKRS
ncbi:MAG: hypothetical protein F6K53_00755 [Moorea sp. SIO4A1]|uniref:hypothetical protein n=1 Tax=Moorena sp. SIO4A1 TaxID=2607835 RepID=UPI00144E5E7F|nr:hypothetical protein [Moorena sp. SIO4A1]NEQ56005.1 hypothetical protein [Moorena sp. SIO4A1]